jgi:hypothetical protein
VSDIPATCGVEPFQYQATPQPGDAGASANQINEQAIEAYLNRLREAVCADLTELFDAGGVLLSFLELTDTPDTYAGSGGLAVAVNAGATGLEFVAFPTIPPAPTYFLTPRLVAMWGPAIATGAFGPTPSVVGGGQLQIGVNPTNTLTAFYRQGMTAGTGANAVAGVQIGVFQCVRGSAAPMGGFRLRWRFGIELYTAGARCWIGLHPVAATQPSGATDPSANVNCIYLGFDDTDTTWQVMHNDAAGTCSKIDLLANFTINTTSMLELTFEVEPSGDLTYTVRDLSLGFTATGTVSSDLPAGGQPLKQCMQIGSAATGASNRISHIFCSLEVGPGE